MKSDEELERAADVEWERWLAKSPWRDDGLIKDGFRAGYLARATEEAVAKADRAKRGAELVAKARCGIGVCTGDTGRDAYKALNELAALLESVDG